jgi:hypothetical protein
VNIIHDPGQDRLIDELYVWVSVDPKTNLEGICGIMVGGQAMQAVTSSLSIAEKMRDHVVEICHFTGKRTKLLRFVKPEIIYGEA